MIVVAWIACAPVETSAPSMGLDDDGHLVAAAPSSLPDGPVDPGVRAAVLRVSLDGHGELAGRYRVDAGRLVFRSASPAAPGRRYVALGAGGTAAFTVDPAPAPEPVVVSFLSESELPANALKLYVAFSEPMRPDPALLEQVELRDLTVGRDVQRPAFHDLPLWSADARRLTLLFHPGRQKTDVGFGARLGPVLTVGHRYEVVLQGGGVSVGGAPAPDARFEFTAGPVDHVPPDPLTWQVEAVSDGFVVALDERVEPVLAAAAFQVIDATGSVPVRAEVEAATVRLHLERAAVGPVRIEQVGPVEDLAGNTPGRVFDAPAGSAVPTSGWRWTTP